MKPRATKIVLTAFVAGVLFAAGLVLGGMTQPSKVIGFLDVAGNWDPSLAFVMGGAVAVFLPLFRLIKRRTAPVCGVKFAVPTRSDIDKPLVIGSALFGIGWGLAGYCPGPAMTSLGSMAPEAMLFTAAMIGGFGLKRGYDYLLAKNAAKRLEETQRADRPSQSSPEAGQPA